MARYSLVRSWDSFMYKRLKDGVAQELTDESRLGAALSVFSTAVLLLLFCFELLAYLTVTSRTEVVMAPHSSEPVRLAFNITFPRLPCHLVAVDVADTLGTLQQNVTQNVVKFKVDTATGRALMLMQDGRAPARYESEEGDFGALKDESRVVVLDVSTFPSLVTGFDVVLVAYGAPWCPWSRKLAPVLEQLATVVGDNADVRIGRVDCTDPGSVQLCQNAHIQSYPSIIVYKGRKTHSDIHYHGDRTEEKLLSFLVAVQQDEDLVSSEHSAEGHVHGEELQRKLGLLPPLTDMGAKFAAAAGHVHDPKGVHDAAKEGDPANPGKALALIESMHKAGMAAPGDAARAALKMAKALVGANSTEGGEQGAAAAGTNGTAGSAGAGTEGCARPAEDAPVGDGDADSGVSGCRIAGWVEVLRVPGYLQVSPPASGLSFTAGGLNMSHIVHDLFFGTRLTEYQLSRLPAGTEEELHRQRGGRFLARAAHVSFEHYLSVVGSSFHFSTRHVVDTFRYTANSHAIAGTQKSQPHVKWGYELSAMALRVQEVRLPLSKFLLEMGAIVGGVWTVTSLVDSALHYGLKSLQFKQTIGKQG